jgi:uncharacterized membrane protein/glutaredoxin
MTLSFNTNITNVAACYLQQLNVPVTKTSFIRLFEQDPNYPSLYSISNTFNKFGIVSQAFTITSEELLTMEAPFIVYYRTAANSKDFILINRLKKDTVSFISAGNKETTVSKQEFLKNWEKIVLVAESTATSGEKDYAINLKKEKQQQTKKYWLYAGAVSIVLLVVAAFIYNTGNTFLIAAIIIAAIKLLGIMAAALLLIYEIDRSNLFVKSICTAGKQTNCDAVLNSKASKFLGMSWSEAGFFYFAATTIFLFSGIDYSIKSVCIATAGTIAAAYIPFSIYYQWKVVKQWCPLCLTVQIILALELTWAIISVWIPSTRLTTFPELLTLIDPVIIIQILLSILLPVVILYLIKPVLLKAKDESLYKNAYKRLLYNPEVFNGLLQQQETAPDGWQHLGITIGNPTAANTIIKVCNPYCGPCAKAHALLEEIIQHNENVNLKIIFTATNNENDQAAKPVQHLLAINSKQDNQLIKKALDCWYLADKKDYEAFAAKYPMNGELALQKEKIDSMKKWCDEAGITHTPTLFINGRRIPEMYNTEELKNIF